MTDMLVEVVAALLICVLASAAVHKLTQRQRMALAAARLLGVGLPLGGTLSLAAAATEGLAAVAILSPSGRVAGATLAAIVWAIYAVALAAARARRIAPFDCGCSFAVRAKPIDALAIGRPLLLAALAVLLATTQVAPADIGLSAAFAALAFFILSLAGGELAALPSTKRNPAR